MNFFLAADYYYEPNLSEIRKHEKNVAERHAKNINVDTPEWAKASIIAMSSALSGSFHEVFDSECIAIFKDSKWQIVNHDTFGVIIDDETQDYPVIYLQHFSPLCIGRNWKKQGDWRVSLDISSSWDNYTWEWDSLLLEVAEKFFDFEKKDEEEEPISLRLRPTMNRFEAENLISVLHKLVWHKSICWETGIDEGGFEPGETIFEL